VTPMQITEEKEPDKVSSLALDAPIQSFQQSDQEVKSVLDTNILNTSRNPLDISKDELGSNEQEERNSTIGNRHLNSRSPRKYEPVPDSSILTSTLPPDEKQPEAEPSRHIEEVQEPSLEQYTPSGAWETLLLGERKKSLNMWMRSSTCKPSPMTEIGNPS
jgi:hypothetical protein